MCLRGCGRGVHLVACLRTSKNYGAAGRLICVECRLEEILESGNPADASASLEQQVTLAAVAELTTGAVSTAAGRNNFVSLERRWALEHITGTGGAASMVILPRHSMEAFIAFMWWLVTSADGARSFGTTMRAAGAVMTMLELVNWTKSSRVKAQIKEIEKKFGVEPEPCTQTTHRIIAIMIDETIIEVCSKGKDSNLNDMMIFRTQALLVLELMAGLRVGEATSSGDLHGLEANDLCFLKPACASTDDGLGETVEVHIRDSKTGPGRHAAFVSVSKGEGALRGGQSMKDWINAAKVEMELRVDGGFEVESPNYWVARLNLVSFTAKQLERFLFAVKNSLCEPIIRQAAAIRKYSMERLGAKNLASEARYVNVAGGARYAAGGGYTYNVDLMAAWKWFLDEQGFGAHAVIEPGPLIRATLGTTLTHMLLTTKSTYTHLVASIDEESLRDFVSDV